MPSYDFQGDWSRMAKLIVRGSHQTQPGENIRHAAGWLPGTNALL